MFKLAVLAFVVAFAIAEKSYFDGMSKETMKHMLGARLDGNHMSRDHGHVSYVADSIPASFDSAQQWGHCASTINYIKDQAACGSCWAVAASSVIADRLCIHCDGVCPQSKANELLNEKQPCIDISEEQIMACCSWCGDGCQGGYPIDAMRYFAYSGVVSGGWFGSKCGCLPYEVNPTDRTEHPTPRCKKTCQPGYPFSFAEDKHYGKDHYTIEASVSAIQTEIMTNGPVECAFSVYENFYKYPKAFVNTDQIYTQKEGKYLGGHAIKITGWGEQDGIPYWTIHNSWNTTWGLTGEFKFKRGIDLCGMESQCVAALPKCNNKNKLPLSCINQ